MRKLIASLMLALILSATAFAGDIPCPGLTGPQESPGITGPQESPGLTGDLMNDFQALATLFGISWSG